MALRTYRLAAEREAVLRLARLRKPQRDSFDFVHKLIESLDADLPEIDRGMLSRKLREADVQVGDWPPEMAFELATGVGKTRLMGALIAYLFRSGQSRNALILAPRAAIVEKLEREIQLSSPKYLLVDPSLVSTPNVCLRSNVEGFTPDTERLNLFILTPQSVTGGERRFSRRTDFGESLADYLRGVPDLVIYVDESHHVQGMEATDASAWREAVVGLSPKLQFGFSATPRKAPNSTVVHSYGLAQCLRDGLYTKAVKLWVEQAPEEIDEDSWDHTTLDFGLRRLEKKRQAILEHTDRNPGVEFVEPVMLVSARETEHADKVGRWLREQRGFADEEVHVAHSHRRMSEDELKKLVVVDQPGNKIRVVVNVFQLTEGWDVTNVYVVAPLRAMATYQNAVQSMGRGLRLPFGDRTGDPEVDTLDVLCFGRESFERIIEQAIEEFGEGPEGSATLEIASKDDDEPDEPKKSVEIKVGKELRVAIPRIVRVPPEPDLDFDIAKIPRARVVSGLDVGSMDRVSTDEVLSYDIDHVVREAIGRILSDLPYLSPASHKQAVERLVKGVLRVAGVDETTREVAVDPVRLALTIEEEIDSRYKSQLPEFKVKEGADELVVGSFNWSVPESYVSPVWKATVAEWK